MEESKSPKSRWRRIAAYWRQESARSLPWWETIVLSALVPALGLGLHPGDPLFLSAGFPWPVLIPLLTGLRQGLSCSFVSSGLLGAATVVSWQHGLPAGAEFPGAYLAGLMAVSLVASEYRGHWHRTLDSLSGSERYHRMRLEQFAKSYHILKTSHDNLEQQICAGTRSLRGALSDLQKQMLTLETSPGRPFRGAAGGILQLFSEYGMLQMASLWEVSPDGAVAAEPAASLGAPRPLRRNDPILVAALARKRAVALSPGHESSENGILAAVPLVDVGGRVHGIVTVDELPFVALQNSNLNLLSVFGGHIADCLAGSKGGDAGASSDFCAFREAVQRAVVDARNCQVPAMLVGLSLSTVSARPQLVESLVLNVRGLDHVWVSDAGTQGIVVLKLMPCTDRVGVERYIWRLDRLLKTQWGIPLSAEGVNIGIESINGSAGADQVLGKFNRLIKPTRVETRASQPRMDGAPLHRESRWSSYS